MPHRKNLITQILSLKVQTGQVEEVTIAGREISGSFKSGESFMTYSPETDNSALIGELIKGKVRINGKAPEKQSFLAQIFVHWFPFLLLIGVWIFFMRQMQGGGAAEEQCHLVKARQRCKLKIK